MLIESSVITAFVTGIVQNMCTDFVEGIIGKTIKYTKRGKIAKKIDNTVEFLVNFEVPQQTLFFTDLQAAFTKDNLKSIARQIQEDGSLDIENSIREKLEILCVQYNVQEEGKRITEYITDLFFEIACDYDSSLANKLFFNRLNRQNFQLLAKTENICREIDQIKTYFLSLEAKQESIFVLLQKSETFFSNFYNSANTLFYPESVYEQYYEQFIDTSALIIKGRQGSGKTTLALKMSVDYSLSNPEYVVLYTNIISDWYSIFQQINSTRNQFSACKFIWVIDNIHRIPEFEQDIVNLPFDGDDKFIFVRRNIDKVSKNPYRVEASVWNDDNVIRIDIDNITFTKYLFADPLYKGMTYRDAEKIFSLCGGDLSLLAKYKDLYKRDIVSHLQDENQVLQDIFEFYFPNHRYNYTYADFQDALQVLTLGMLDMAIPPVMQMPVCNSMLGQFCYSNYRNELEFEHSTVAELLFSGIVYFLQQDWVEAYTRNLTLICNKLISDYTRTDIKATRINSLIQAAREIAPIMPINKEAWNEVCHYSQIEGIHSLLRDYSDYISPTNWKQIFSATKYRDIHLDLFTSALHSGALFESLLKTGDLNFRFIYKRIGTDEAVLFNEQVLNNIRKLSKIIDSCSKTTALFRSLQPEFAIRCIQQLNQYTLTNAMTNNDDGYYVVSCGFKYISKEVVQALEAKLGNEYISKMLHEASLCALVQFLELLVDTKEFAFSTIEKDKKAIIEHLLSTQIDFDKYSVIVIRISARDIELKKRIESIFAQDNYLQFLREQGDFQNLLQILWISSPSVRRNLIVQIKDDNILETLILRMQNGTKSIGHLNMYIHRLAEIDPECWLQIEELVLPSRFIELISSKGTMIDLYRICSQTTDKYSSNVLSAFQNDYQLLEKLIQQTIKKRTSLGSFGLVLHDMPEDVLIKFETLIRADGMVELCRRNGNLAVLLRIMENSSEKMQTEISEYLTQNDSIRMELIRNTVEDKEKIGTFALWLRGLKQKSENSLSLFEKALGIDGFLQLLSAQGDLIILSRVLQYTTDATTIEIIKALELNPMIVEDLFISTIEMGTNINTFSFILREFKEKDTELLKRYEELVGKKRFIDMFKTVGNLPAIFRVLAYMSPELRLEIINELHEQKDSLNMIVENTLSGKHSLRTLCLSLREINKELSSGSEVMNQLMDADTWIDLFVQNGDLLSLLKSILELPQDIRINILNKLIDDDNLEILVDRCIEKKLSLGTLPLDIRQYNKNEKDKIAFNKLMSPELFNKLMFHLGNLSAFIKSLGESSTTFLEKYESQGVDPALIHLMFETSVQTIDKLFDVHYGLRYLRAKNLKLLVTIENEITVAGYIQLFLQGTPLFQVLRIAAYSSLGYKLCQKIHENSHILDDLLNYNELYNKMFEGGFHIDIFNAINFRNSYFEKIINDISTEKWVKYLHDYSTEQQFISVVRWLQGETILRIIEYFSEHPTEKEEMKERWQKNIRETLPMDSHYLTNKEILSCYGWK